MSHTRIKQTGNAPIQVRKKAPLLGASLLAASLCPSLSLAETAMPEATLESIQVEAQQPVRGTFNNSVTHIGKQKQALKDIPQSITVVNQQVLQDQGVTNLKDALRNVPGITFAAGEGGRTGDQVVIRGFAATTDTYLDGQRDIGQYNRDPFAQEKVEVLKGSSSMLFGRGSTGGVVNQVSKAPYVGTGGEVDVSLGNHRSARTTVDVNHAFTDDVAVRLNAMWTKDGSFRDPVEQKRYGIAPSVGFGLSGDTQLVLSHMHMQEDNVPDYGVPYHNATQQPLALGWDKFYGLGSDFEHTQTDISTAKLTHRFNEHTEINSVLRYGRYERDVSPTAPRLLSQNDVTAASIMRRSKPLRDGVDSSLVSTTDFTTQFETGPVPPTPRWVPPTPMTRPIW